MTAFALRLSRKHHPALPDVLPGHAWFVLVQADDTAADAPVAAQLEAALAAAAEAGVIAGRGDRPDHGPGRCALDAAREHQRSPAAGRPEHQARHLSAGFACRNVPRRSGSGAVHRAAWSRVSWCSDIWATATCITTFPAPEGIAATGIPRAHRARQPDRLRPGRRARWQHQCRAWHRAIEARRTRALQESAGARADARGSRPCSIRAVS